MAPGCKTKTLTVGCSSRKVHIVGTDSRGCGTGDSMLILEDQNGHRSRWLRLFDQTSVRSRFSNTGDQWGTLG